MSEHDAKGGSTGAAPQAEPHVADQIAQEEPEDIDAFLAELEQGAAAKAASAAPAPKAAPDPFADAFASLEGEHGAAVERELATRAPAPVPKAPVSKAQVKPAPEAEVAVVHMETPVAAEPPESSKKDKKSKKAKDDVRAVETVRSPGFRFAVSAAKAALWLTPTLLWVWLVGAYLSGWFTAGWLVSVLALTLALVVPAALRLSTKRGRYAWWLGGLSLVGVVALAGAMPLRSGEALASYGHWPMSTVGQLAGWPADHGVVTAPARASRWMGHKLERVKHPQHQPTSKPLALGTERSLTVFAAEQAAAAAAGEAAAAKEAAPTAPSETAPVPPAEAPAP